MARGAAPPPHVLRSSTDVRCGCERRRGAREDENRTDQPPVPVEWCQESYTVRETLEAQTYSEHAIVRWVMGRIASDIPHKLTDQSPCTAHEGWRDAATR